MIGARVIPGSSLRWRSILHPPTPCMADSMLLSSSLRVVVVCSSIVGVLGSAAVGVCSSNDEGVLAQHLEKKNHPLIFCMINPDLQAPDPESVDLSEWRKPKMESTKSWAYISVAVAVANVSQYKYVLCVVLRQTKDLYNVIMSKLTVEYSVSSQVVVAGTAKKGQSAIMGIVVQMQAIFKPIIHVFT